MANAAKKGWFPSPLAQEMLCLQAAIDTPMCHDKRETWHNSPAAPDAHRQVVSIYGFYVLCLRIRHAWLPSVIMISSAPAELL